MTATYAVVGSIATLAMVTSMTPKVAVGDNLPTATACGSYGIAASADWARKTTDEVQQTYALARGVGACGVRISVAWPDIEPRRGAYSWENLDALINGATAAGVEPMLALYAAPDWALAAHDATPSGSSGSSSNPSRGSSTNEGFAADFGSFAAAVASRYAQVVNAYEVWNEPNVSRFWPSPSIDEYATLLQATYPRIHAADSTATVVSAGLAPTADTSNSISPVKFTRGLYERGAQRYFDVMGIHPYTWNDPPEDRLRFLNVDELEGTMNEFGDTSKQMWVTEYGAPSGGLGGLTQTEQWEIIQWGIGEAARHPRIGRFYIYTLQDYPLGLTNPESYFGLYTSQGKPKIAANELRAQAVS
ncbi:beta-galactosidase [Corynebacterium capitovis]|uniref:beta-galactosidase n=1 Tax=Corynebacterium capitovis TaxID=131081 RepID=UPI000379632B|nr:beta-galactosidase [Corynebacterium capitovis]